MPPYTFIKNPLDSVAEKLETEGYNTGKAKKERRHLYDGHQLFRHGYSAEPQPRLCGQLQVLTNLALVILNNYLLHPITEDDEVKELHHLLAALTRDVVAHDDRGRGVVQFDAKAGDTTLQQHY